MAKQTDLTKIERIREAAIRVFGRNGSANAPVAAIAREAGVSVGYLYRHYAGKEDLLNDLLEKTLEKLGDKVEELAAQRKSTEESIRGFVRYIFVVAREQPARILYVLHLQNDLSWKIAESTTGRLKDLCGHLLTLGRSAKTVAPGITAEDLYIILFCLPLQYIGTSFRNIFRPVPLPPELPDKVADMCLTAVRNGEPASDRCGYCEEKRTNRTFISETYEEN